MSDGEREVARGSRASVPDAELPPAAGFLEERLERLAELAAGAGPALREEAETYAGWVLETLDAGGKLLLCGNGGSAAAAEHVAAEYVVRFRRRRDPLPAVALTSSAALLTAAANDLGYEEAFARAVRALADPSDLLVVHSTSGDSPSAVRAAEAAAELGLRVVGLLAGDGGRLAEVVDLALVVPTEDPALAQEIHIAVEHAVVGEVEERLSADGSGAA